MVTSTYISWRRFRFLTERRHPTHPGEQSREAATFLVSQPRSLVHHTKNVRVVGASQMSGPGFSTVCIPSLRQKNCQSHCQTFGGCPTHREPIHGAPSPPLGCAPADGYSGCETAPPDAPIGPPEAIRAVCRDAAALLLEPF